MHQFSFSVILCFIQPSFSCTPLKTDEDVNNWLTFNVSSAPLVCLSVFYNIDQVRCIIEVATVNIKPLI